MDLKDKWRNLVKLVTDPNKHARGMDLSEEQRQTILRLVFANDIPATGNTGESPGRCAAGIKGRKVPPPLVCALWVPWLRVAGAGHAMRAAGGLGGMRVATGCASHPCRVALLAGRGVWAVGYAMLRQPPFIHAHGRAGEPILEGCFAVTPAVPSSL